MRILKQLFFLVLFLSASSLVFGQKTITGLVTDGSTGSPLPGVTIKVKNTSNGTVTSSNGKYSISVSDDAATLVFSFIGFETEEKSISGTTINVALNLSSVELSEIAIVADRAKERETPVAFSNVEKKDIEQQLGSRDIPLVLNATPGVYATAQGGGAGDARINIRGFNQRNVAVMINGVPMNDMENGWVYWSNWDGLADATSSIQVQRGLSAVNLATPSVGGTMNIITSPAEKEAGVSAKFEYGSGNFMKTTLAGHTGLINDKIAASVSVVGKQGDGVIDGTWTKAAAYYGGLTYKANDKHKFEVFAMGAPQRHGQNLYKQNIAAYGHDIAKDIEGYDVAALDEFPEADVDNLYAGYPDFPAEAGRYYNENWSPVSSSYTGKQYWNGAEHDRYDENFLSERENFYHKPLVNLNWYAKWTRKIKQYTVLYYSGGTGGGTGTYGDVAWNYNAGIYDSPSRFVHWDQTIENNTASDTAFGILRNSRNDQWTLGALSKVQFLINENFKAQIGVDWRTAGIDHYRDVRDLLGGQFFYYDGNDFDSGSDYNKVLGDRIAYNFNNTVDWYGMYGQAEYSNDVITAYGTVGGSMIGYTYTNHFAEDPENPGESLYAETEMLSGYQIKGGVSYKAIDGLSIFVNGGYVSKAPIFDAVISDRDGTVAADPLNENFIAFELGTSFASSDNRLKIKANYYYTTWENRTLNIGIQKVDGSEGFVFIQGLNQLHSGFELEANYNPIDIVAIGAIASIGNWNYTSDVSGTYKDYEGVEHEAEDTYYTEGLKVGDAPQTQFGAKLVLAPVKGLNIQVIYRYNMNHYADWDPTTRTDETDDAQVWETPAYGIMDAHLSYQLPLSGKLGIEVFGHLFNALDEIYIQDAVDNSSYNSYQDDDGIVNPHSPDAAEVFLGLPRTFNAGLRFTF
ncbi:MAG: carboxypeptidase-like regulatory domain-containing protein [Bacteroidota bacterium]|nr:carboxypeptidase-like regulatory domain-containing protein [Bacteroidota bacterium]